MCAEIQVSFLDKLSLRNWYKYTLYLSAILLILAVSIDTKIEQSKLLNFSVKTMILSCGIWIFNEMLRITSKYCDEEGEKGLLVLKFFFDWILFIIWAILIAPILL